MKIANALGCILPLLCCGMPKIAFAQDEVLLTNGQTIKGTITMLRTSFVRIRPIGTNKIETHRTDEINYLHRGNSTQTPYKYYYSKKMVSVNSNEAATIPKLLQLRAWGKIRTYSYIEDTGTHPVIRYFIEKDDSGLIFIGFTSGAFNIQADPMTAEEITRQVALLFEDNPGIKSRFEGDEKKYKRKKIQLYVKEYNDWFKSVHQ